MTPIHPPLLAAALSVLAACASAPAGPEGSGAAQVTRFQQVAPPGAEPGTCWGKIVTPAIIETVTRQIEVQPARPAGDGTEAKPGIYKTETRQEIVRERSENWFRTPCPDEMTPEFVSSVQRALRARGLYRGAITGAMTPATRAAVRRFQKPQGLDTGILSLEGARKLGLVAIEREAT